MNLPIGSEQSKMISSSQKHFRELAAYYAEHLETDLEPEELQGLRWEIIRFKGKPTKSLCKAFNRIKVPEEMEIKTWFPFPSPFHHQDNASMLMTALANKKIEIYRRENLAIYIAENEVELLERVLRAGPEKVVFLDAPKYITHRHIMKALRGSLMKVLEGKHLMLRLEEKVA